eukprot:CAMPEP_0172738856 /NCGR_PEP_ID=MMETSP1074-20121228/121173_1 /TAXON_ID=2916 /ORGANISM="Ceratium fusus, Strain PA161109" /LENGTH=43 /DNA_ID= /DNA_START= /DNA_END= /DNA_ORIENTATION=
MNRRRFGLSGPGTTATLDMTSTVEISEKSGSRRQQQAAAGSSR